MCSPTSALHLWSAGYGLSILLNFASEYGCSDPVHDHAISACNAISSFICRQLRHVDLVHVQNDFLEGFLGNCRQVGLPLNKCDVMQPFLKSVTRTRLARLAIVWLNYMRHKTLQLVRYTDRDTSPVLVLIGSACRQQCALRQPVPARAPCANPRSNQDEQDYD